MFAIDIIMVLAFGGFTILWGAMIGAASLTFLNEYLTIFADYKRAIYGLSLIVIMLFFPNGLLQGLKDSVGLLLKLRRRESVKNASSQ
jgi:branched-chain amino acid transport system permease protein